MADKQFSDTSEQSLSLATKILAEDNSITNKFSHVTGQKVIDLLVAQGYLTQTEIEALSSLIKASDFNDDSVIQKKGGIMTSTLISELITAYPKLLRKGFLYTATSNLIVEEGRFFNEHFTGITKTFGIFAKGSGSGCLNAASISAKRQYYIFLIKETSTGDYDIFVDYVQAGTNIPSGWTEEFIIGFFYTNSSASVEQTSIVFLNEYADYGLTGKSYPLDYVSDVIFEITAPDIITISKCFARDDTDSFNLRSYSDYDFAIGTVSASTQYYLFMGWESNRITFEKDTSSTGSGISGTYKRLIGIFKTTSVSGIDVDSVYEWRNITNKAIIGDFLSENYSQFKEDGTLRFRGDATTWDDIASSLIARKLDSTTGTLNYNFENNTITMSKNGLSVNTSDNLVLNYQKLHKIKADSSLHLHMHFEQPSSDKYEWTINYRKQYNGGAKTTTWTSLTADTDNDCIYGYLGGSTFNQIIELCSISLADMGLSDILQIKVCRTDGQTPDIEALFIDSHVESDGAGSETEWTKDN